MQLHNDSITRARGWLCGPVAIAQWFAALGFRVGGYVWPGAVAQWLVAWSFPVIGCRWPDAVAQKFAGLLFLVIGIAFRCKCIVIRWMALARDWLCGPVQLRSRSLHYPSLWFLWL